MIIYKEAGYPIPDALPLDEILLETPVSTRHGFMVSFDGQVHVEKRIKTGIEIIAKIREALSSIGATEEGVPIVFAINYDHQSQPNVVSKDASPLCASMAIGDIGVCMSAGSCPDMTNYTHCPAGLCKVQAFVQEYVSMLDCDELFKNKKMQTLLNELFGRQSFIAINGNSDVVMFGNWWRFAHLPGFLFNSQILPTKSSNKGDIKNDDTDSFDVFCRNNETFECSECGKVLASMYASFKSDFKNRKIMCMGCEFSRTCEACGTLVHSEGELRLLYGMSLCERCTKEITKNDNK